MMPCLSNTYSRRGAMFGLDARIALAIFAGLGVIAGAMVYKVVTQTRVAALVTEMSNIGKGFGDYVLDIGVAPSRIEDLMTSTGGQWNGPYVDFKDTFPGLNNFTNFPRRTDSISLAYFADDAWSVGSESACVVGNCWGWLMFGNGDTRAEVYAAIDKAIDSTVNPDEGRFRFEQNVDGGQSYFKLGSVRTAGF